MIIVSRFLVPNGYIGITLWPFIFIKDERYRNLKELINHEKIHIRQQVELLVVPFYLLYGLNYIVNLFRKGNAYKNIVFEKEANANEYNLTYLNTRPFWAWTKYF